MGVVAGTARTDPQDLAKITGASKTQVRRAPCAQCSSVTRKPVGFGCWVTTPSRQSEAPPNATFIPPAPQPRPIVELLVVAPHSLSQREHNDLVHRDTRQLAATVGVHSSLAAVSGSSQASAINVTKIKLASTARHKRHAYCK